MGQSSDQFKEFIRNNNLVNQANQLAYEYMSVLKRRQEGKTMYDHVFEVAFFIYELGIDQPEVIAAALLHDIIEDSEKRYS